MVSIWGFALHFNEAIANKFVGAIGNPAGGVRVSWATVRRVVLDATVLRRVMTWGDDNAIGLPVATVRQLRVVVDDRNRNGRGWGVAIVRIDES